MISVQFSRVAARVKARVHRHILDGAHDRRRGIRTSGVHSPDELALRGPNAGHAVEYQPTPTILFRRVLNALALNHERFAFVDLGSGKGRVLLMAAEYPFLRVEGVELSERLHTIASANIAQASGRPHIRAPMHAINADATEYTLPAEPFVLYMYNPFDDVVLASVCRGLEASLRASPRECFIIYANPKHRQVLDRMCAIEEVLPATWDGPLARLLSPWPILVYRARSAVIDGAATPAAGALHSAGM